MKTMTVLEAKNDLSRALRFATKDLVVLTRGGKPVAAIQRITKADLEDLQLERSEKFWEMIARSRRGKGVPLDEVRHRLGLEPAKRPRRKKRRS